MLKDSGDLNAMEWALYSKWFDNFAVDLPIKGVIHVTTAVDTSADRIQIRGREGEGGIPKSYLAALDQQHYKWLDNTTMPVLRISTEKGVSFDKNVNSIKQFIHDISLKENIGTVFPDMENMEEEDMKINKFENENGSTPMTVTTNTNTMKVAPSPFTMNSVAIETL